MDGRSRGVGGKENLLGVERVGAVVVLVFGTGV